MSQFMITLSPVIFFAPSFFSSVLFFASALLSGTEKSRPSKARQLPVLSAERIVSRSTRASLSTRSSETSNTPIWAFNAGLRKKVKHKSSLNTCSIRKLFFYRCNSLLFIPAGIQRNYMRKIPLGQQHIQRLPAFFTESFQREEFFAGILILPGTGSRNGKRRLEVITIHTGADISHDAPLPVPDKAQVRLEAGSRVVAICFGVLQQLMNVADLIPA